MSGKYVPPEPTELARYIRQGLNLSADSRIRAAWGSALQQTITEKLINSIVRGVEAAMVAVARAQEESHFDTAQLDSSVRIMLRDADTRMMRKIPAGVNASISRTDSSSTFTVPRFTAFTGGGFKFYNRYPIVFPIGESVVQATLYVGTPKSVTFTSDGTDFSTWLSPEGSFTVSDGYEVYNGVEYTDLSVYAGGTPVQVTRHAAWWELVSPQDKAVRDTTTIDGRCQLTFGDPEYGFKPTIGTQVTVQYVVTDGSSSNRDPFNATISMVGSNAITAFPIGTRTATNPVLISRIRGGADEVPASVYRKTGPHLYASFGTAIRTKSVKAWAMNYPGIADALVLGQAAIAPDDRRYMNVLRVSLLKGGRNVDPDDYQMDSTEVQGWLTHFNKRRPQNTSLIEFFDPVPSSPPLDIMLLCEPHVNLPLARQQGLRAIQDLFAYQPGSLRRTILRSDLTSTLQNAAQGISGVRVNGLMADLVTYSRAPKATVGDPSTTGPLLPLGDYIYYVVAICEVYDGSVKIEERSKPSSALIVNTDGTYNPHIVFDSVVGAVRYEVYGRDSTPTLLAVLDFKANSFTDSPTLIPDSQVLDYSPPSAIRFPKLGSLVINAKYRGDEE